MCSSDVSKFIVFTMPETDFLADVFVSNLWYAREHCWAACCWLKGVGWHPFGTFQPVSTETGNERQLPTSPYLTPFCPLIHSSAVFSYYSLTYKDFTSGCQTLQEDFCPQIFPSFPTSNLHSHQQFPPALEACFQPGLSSRPTNSLKPFITS